MSMVARKGPPEKKSMRAVKPRPIADGPFSSSRWSLLSLLRNNENSRVFRSLKKPWHMLASIIVCQLAGIIGSIATYPSIPTWYASLNKPWFNPPNWIFGPVWLLLYTLMGISAYLVWEKGWEKKEVKQALYVFAGQLALNSLWSILFFGMHELLLSSLEIIALDALIFLCIIKFRKISKGASLLLAPYLLWSSFATLLTFSVWLMNQ